MAFEQRAGGAEFAQNFVVRHVSDPLRKSDEVIADPARAVTKLSQVEAVSPYSAATAAPDASAVTSSVQTSNPASKC
jgi:dTDP-D-glucose 4,6-dehydratase